MGRLHYRYLAGRLVEVEREIDYMETALASQDEDILRDPHRLRGLKYSVLLVTEAIGAVLQHILARKYSIAVEGLAETMFRAGQVGLLPTQMATSFESLARFRNRLVHRYWTVDDRTFLRNLRKGLPEFNEFLTLMERFIRTHKQQEPKTCEPEDECSPGL